MLHLTIGLCSHVNVFSSHLTSPSASKCVSLSLPPSLTQYKTSLLFL
jgi:hypothetical protein